MPDEYLRRLKRRDHELSKALREAIMQVVADYSDCNLLEPMSDVVCELDARGMLSASALIDVVGQWLEEGAVWPPNSR